jgi:uncharacterized protein
MRIEKIIFPAEPGIELVGLLHVPNRSDNLHAGVIICHGMLSDKDSLKHHKLCDSLAMAGLYSFRFDFRCSGESGERNLMNPASIRLSDEIHDLHEAMKVVRRRVSDVSLIGSSFGGAVALLYAAQDPAINAVATMAAVGRPEGLFKRLGVAHRIKEWESAGELMIDGQNFYYDLYEDALQHNVLKACRKIKCPALIVHGSQDQVVDPDDAIKIHKALSGEKKLEMVTGADHAFSEDEHKKHLFEVIYNFILSKSGGPA